MLELRKMREEVKTRHEQSTISDLRSLIQSLSKDELALLKRHLVADSGKKKNKYLMLLELFRNKASETMKEIDFVSAIYGSPGSIQSFRMLRYRLRAKVLDSLINDINIDRYNDWEDIDLIAIKVRKRLTEYFILNSMRPKTFVF